MEGKPLVTSKQKTEVVCGVPTQVVCTAFSTHILVVVTQFGKMGTLVALEPSAVTSDISKPVLTTKVLLGQDEVTGWEGSVGSVWAAAPPGQQRFLGLRGVRCVPEWVLFPAPQHLTSRQAAPLPPHPSPSCSSQEDAHLGRVRPADLSFGGLPGQGPDRQEPGGTEEAVTPSGMGVAVPGVFWASELGVAVTANAWDVGSQSGLLGDTPGIKARRDVVFSPSLPQPLIHVFAKNLVTFVSQEAGNRAVLLAMAMKDRSMEGLRALKEVIQTCQVW